MRATTQGRQLQQQERVIQSLRKDIERLRRERDESRSAAGWERIESRAEVEAAPSSARESARPMSGSDIRKAAATEIELEETRTRL